MSSWIGGSWWTLGYVAVSGALIYLSTVLAIRLLGERRTLAQMTIFDFAVAVALGTVIGRTATTRSPSYVQGITAVVTLLAAHNVVSWARLRFPVSRRLFGRSPVVLVVDGHVEAAGLRRARLTREDLFVALRERGVPALDDVRLAVLESRGAFSVVTSAEIDSALWPEPGS